MLGRVARSSVKNSLMRKARGPVADLERVGHGRYRVRHSESPGAKGP
jgi:hypothetical protein